MGKNVTRYGPWFSVYRCTECEKAVSHYTKMMSNGRCPMCGYKGYDACTIVNTYETAARRVYPTWWKFWKYTIEEK